MKVSSWEFQDWKFPSRYPPCKKHNLFWIAGPIGLPDWERIVAEWMAQDPNVHPMPSEPLSFRTLADDGIFEKRRCDRCGLVQQRRQVPEGPEDVAALVERFRTMGMRVDLAGFPETRTRAQRRRGHAAHRQTAKVLEEFLLWASMQWIHGEPCKESRLL